MTRRNLIYHDLLDTVRTSSLNKDQKKAAAQSIMGAANLMLSVLIGETPVFSQTQAFDSSIILATVQSSEEGAAFRSLLKKGFIRVKLFNQPDLKNAFKKALESSDFIFSGWPELEKGEVEREAVIMSLNGDKITSFPESVSSRLEAINCLNADISESKYKKEKAKKPKRLLKDYIHEAASVEDTELKSVINELDKLESNDRSRHYRALDEMEEIDDNIRESARELVDMYYNKVISDSLGVDGVTLATPKSEAFKNVKNVLAADKTRDITTREPFITEKGDAKDFKKLGWSQIAGLLKNYESSEFDEDYFENASEYLATVHTKKIVFIIAPEVIDLLLIGGFPYVLTEIFPGISDPGLLAGLKMGILGCAKGVKYLLKKCKEREFNKSKVHYKGLLQRVKSVSA